MPKRFSKLFLPFYSAPPVLYNSNAILACCDDIFGHFDAIILYVAGVSIFSSLMQFGWDVTHFLA